MTNSAFFSFFFPHIQKNISTKPVQKLYILPHPIRMHSQSVTRKAQGTLGGCHPLAPKTAANEKHSQRVGCKP